ncbi:uncharacterized protein [Littorina saxatilis]|uniref:Uncharacterized protein n=1 Tax=Littorina saxatilis TaxID=31220 RepID=A0AAN9AK95_9CAEN
MATPHNVSEPDKCPVCLDVYRTPKFLPCFHTFCAECISGVAMRSNRRTFPCPSCREPTTLPRGGAAALQTNFYVNRTSNPAPQQPSSVQQRTGTFCTNHDEKLLEFFCVQCQQPICLNCKLTEHERHTTVDLRKAVDSKNRELIPEKNRLQRAVVDMAERVEKTKAEQQAVRNKKATVLKNIEDRYAILVEAAENYKDKAVDSLNSVSTGIESAVAKVLKKQEGNLQALLKIQQQLNKATNNKTGTEIFTVAKELTSGRASAQSVQRMTSQEVSVISRPVLHFKTTGDVMLQKARDYFGTVSKVDMEATPSEMEIARQFQCGYASDLEIFSLCHENQDSPRLWVSYERRRFAGQVPVEQFNERGDYKTDGATYVGKTSLKAHSRGLIPLCQRADGVDTFSKSLTAPYYKLENNLSGTAKVSRLTISRGYPPRQITDTEFSINVGPHRAFDVDETGQFFVVVEEPATHETWRKVKLYQRPGGYPVNTYTPPTEMFQPSDVCFYTLNGKQVLLVTDELNDCIHVVRVQPGSLSKIPFLTPGCPSLVQPTAMAVDVYARLWLACRGGTILCMEPLANRSRSPSLYSK